MTARRYVPARDALEIGLARHLTSLGYDSDTAAKPVAAAALTYLSYLRVLPQLTEFVTELHGLTLPAPADFEVTDDGC